MFVDRLCSFIFSVHTVASVRFGRVLPCANRCMWNVSFLWPCQRAKGYTSNFLSMGSSLRTCTDHLMVSCSSGDPISHGHGARLINLEVFRKFFPYYALCVVFFFLPICYVYVLMNYGESGAFQLNRS